LAKKLATMTPEMSFKVAKFHAENYRQLVDR
jgi:hypothetical protein